MPFWRYTPKPWEQPVDGLPRLSLDSLSSFPDNLSDTNPPNRSAMFVLLETDPEAMHRVCEFGARPGRRSVYRRESC
jgi:hypothetical protein